MLAHQRQARYNRKQGHEQFVSSAAPRCTSVAYHGTCTEPLVSFLYFAKTPVFEYGFALFLQVERWWVQLKGLRFESHGSALLRCPVSQR